MPVKKLATAVAVPNSDIALLQLLGAGGASDEPEEFLSNAAVKYFLGCQQWEAPVTQ